VNVTLKSLKKEFSNYENIFIHTLNYIKEKQFKGISMYKMLTDIRVLDLTHVWFGPWCTMMLADLGAEVIRIEPPWGAIDRVSEPPLFGGSSFESFRPGTMKRLGIDYSVLKELNPSIIYAALSGFGQYGPYSSRRSYAMIVEAMSGHTRLTGERADPNGPPVEIAEAYGDIGPGTMAAMSIITAIRYRDKTGIGQALDVSQLDCMVAFNPSITGYNLSGMKPLELWEKYPALKVRRIGLLETKDGGWIRLAAFGPRSIDSLRQHYSVEEITPDFIKEKTVEMTRDEAVDFFIKLCVPCAPVYHIDEVVADPHLVARGMFMEMEHPKAGKVKTPNFPIKFSEAPYLGNTAAPLLGEHSKEIFMEILGYTEEKVVELVKAGITTLP
jgi:CoA:oxalate CoA-transferase